LSARGLSNVEEMSLCTLQDRWALDLDDEEHIEPVEPDGVDGEEVRRENAARLGA
jgi:hypothetical protein